MNEPVITITLPAPVETVWDAFRDFEQVRQWHGWETEGDEGSLDDEIRLIYGEGVVASEADRTLHIGGHLFSLVPDGAQTIVRVTRVTPTAAAAEAMDWDAWYDDVDEGWLSFLQQLRFALAATGASSGRRSTCRPTSSTRCRASWPTSPVDPGDAVRGVRRRRGARRRGVVPLVAAARSHRRRVGSWSPDVRHRTVGRGSDHAHARTTVTTPSGPSAGERWWEDLST